MNNNRQKLPEGWTITSMGEVSDVIGGGTPSTKVSDNFDEKSGYPWITPADLSNFTDIYIKRGRRFLTEKGLNSCSARLVPTGSVLLSSRAPIGYVAIAANELCTNQGFKSFVCHEGLESEFIYYWLIYKRQELQQMGSGSTFAELSSSRAKQIPLVISPTREQTIISEVLKKLFARVNITKDRLDNAAEMIRRFRKSVLNSACSGRLTEEWREKHPDIEPASVFVESFITKQKRRSLSQPNSYPEQHTLPETWIWMPFEKLVSNWDGKRIPVKASDRKVRHGSYPYYGASGIIDCIDDYLFEGDYLLIGEDGANLLARSKPIAFIASGEFWVNNHAHVLRTLGGIPLEYLEIYINSIDLQPYVTGTAQPKLTQRNMNMIPVPVPPLEEQEEIVCRVEGLFKLVDSIEKRVGISVAKADKLTQSILSKAFKGELVPTEAELARIEGRDYETAKELLGCVAKAKVAEANDKEKKKMKEQFTVKHKKQPVRRPLVDVINENPKGITPENLLRIANYTIEEIDDFYCDLSNIMQEIEEIKPSGSQAKKWPTHNKVLIKPKKV